MSLLQLKKVSAYYGKIQALSDISLHIEQGEIVTLIGSNGAGKTTTLKAICGQVETRGTILFQDQDIVDLPPHDIVKKGIAHVPEGRRIFPRLTVKENLEIGAFHVKDKQIIKERMENIFHYFPRIKERLHQKGGTMSGGEQQMLAIGRALMMEPQLLLMDEPSMGLAPIIVEKIFEIIVELNRQGMTILLVEQNAYQALQIASRGYVMQNGEITMKGTASTLIEDEQIQEAYLA